MKTSIFILFFTLFFISGCNFITTPYSKNEKYVYYGSQIIEGVDPKTFEILNNSWGMPQCCPTPYAKDKNNIYYNGKIVSGADLETFQIVKAYFAKDKNHVYQEGKVSTIYKDPQKFNDIRVAPECGNN